MAIGPVGFRLSCRGFYPSWVFPPGKKVLGQVPSFLMVHIVLFMQGLPCILCFMA